MINCCANTPLVELLSKSCVLWSQNLTADVCKFHQKPSTQLCQKAFCTGYHPQIHLYIFLFHIPSLSWLDMTIISFLTHYHIGLVFTNSRWNGNLLLYSVTSDPSIRKQQQSTHLEMLSVRDKARLEPFSLTYGTKILAYLFPPFLDVHKQACVQCPGNERLVTLQHFIYSLS